MTFFERILKAAAKAYRADESGPGITFAWLKEKNCWYASLCRYEDGQTKKIVAKAYSRESVDHAILILAAAWGSRKNAPAIAKKLAMHGRVQEAVDKVLNV